MRASGHLRECQDDLRNKGDDMRKIKYATLLILSFLVFSTMTVASAEEYGKEEGIRKQKREREVKVRIEADRVRIESEIEVKDITGEIENKFKVDFKVTGEVEIKLKYEEEFEDTVEAETKLQFRVGFDSIVEFVDADNDGLYDNGEEVSVYKLDGKQFTPIFYTTQDTPNNVTEHVITTQTIDGIFKVTLHVVGDFANIAGEMVKPTEVKIDLEINNFPYTNENSKLALKCKVESEMKIEEEKETEYGEEKIEVRYGNYQGFFSWRRTAYVDGIEREVKSTTLVEDPEEGGRKLYLIYEHGDSIVHDPKIGITGRITAPISPTFYWAAVIFVVIAILATTGYMLRKKVLQVSQNV